MKTLTALILLAITASTMVAETLVIAGVIEGAPYQIAVPAEHTGNILIHAHGYRPEGSSLLAERELENTAHGELVANGWIVAMSAFRRNGLIIRDAMEDLMLLRDHIEEVYGPLTLIILEGQSMGGAIVTHLAERRPDLFNGVIAIGAALQAEDPEDPLTLGRDPKIPILFLTNRSEITGPLAYVEATNDAPVPPILWKIERDGHVNVNERLLAIDALVSWTTTGNINANRDITVEVELSDSSVRFDNYGAIGRVIDITHNHGNVFINFGPTDFNRLDIAKGDHFGLTVGRNTLTVLYGTTFSDVPKGDWTAFPTAEGDTIVAINFGNAFEHLNPAIGDEVRVEAIGSTGK